ncbi:periaxin-like [Panicum miliaceum]|uniref:Periaxin-like n=1 Tax=Panicum miliaceum TaxID=4540 RepID=A0A3L6RM31_PANMI|nr:periaxin-like [Panicum miliaceum]
MQGARPLRARTCPLLHTTSTVPELPVPEHKLPPFPELHLQPFPEVDLPSKPELPEVELPPKPEIPGVPEFHFPEPEAKP